MIDYNSYKTTKSFGKRIRFLILHYTAVNFSDSIAELTKGPTSAHYLVPDPTDPTYIQAGFKEMRIFSLVDECDRAWHAGVSAWEDRTSLNDTSIGIETVNLARDDNGVFRFPPFQKAQIEVIIALARNILQRYPDITPTHVLGHSDIAVGRKSDPGAAFPWHQLHKSGVGAWYDSSTKAMFLKRYGKHPLSKEAALQLFKTYGYDTSSAATDAGFKSLVRAFQLHFRPAKYDGVLDVETAAILASLVSKYFPAKETLVA
ncbi:N-acetylmuramoyl-L-alanine amidase [Phyllobacteriaceae bacterium JZ32]